MVRRSPTNPIPVGFHTSKLESGLLIAFCRSTALVLSRSIALVLRRSTAPPLRRSGCCITQGYHRRCSWGIMSAGRSLLRKKNLLRITGDEKSLARVDQKTAPLQKPNGGDEASPEVMISFLSSGLTANQWRKLKNLWHPGKTLFRPSRTVKVKDKEQQFFGPLANSSGPTCIAYLPPGATSKSEFLPFWDSMDDDLLLLYGKYKSSLVHHLDVKKAYGLDDRDLESSVFQFFLPSSYLSFVCSPEDVKS